jgi:hypothetical protein
MALRSIGTDSATWMPRPADGSAQPQFGPCAQGATRPQHHAAARERAQYAAEQLANAELQLSTGRTHFGEWSEAWGRRAAEAVLRTAPDTDGFFCGNDQIAREGGGHAS